MIVPYQGFIGGSYHGTSRRVGVEQCLNWIPEINGGPGVRPSSQMSFHPTPGTKTFTTAGTGPVRGVTFENGRLVCVSGAEVYSVNASGTATKLGDVEPSQEASRIRGNGSGGKQFLIESGSKGYLWNWDTGAFGVVASVNFPSNCSAIDFVDGYFLALNRDSRQVNYSNLFDGVTWDALDLFQKSQTTDDIRNLAVINKLVYLHGSTTTEIWQNTGDALVTFQPVQGVPIEHGIDAPDGLSRVGESMAWLGMDAHGAHVAWRDVNYAPSRISNYAVEQEWASYGRTDNAEAFTYRWRGHTLFVVSFPTAKRTWVADMDTNPPIWHEWGYHNPATGLQEHALGRCHAFGFGKHIVGSRLDGTLYELGGRYDADTTPIRRVRRAPHVSVPQRSLTINRFAMMVDTGIAASSGQGSDPRIMFRSSIDGGMTYSDEILLETGKLGQYRTRVEINRLGQGEDWVLEAATSEPIEQSWSDASIDAVADAA